MTARRSNASDPDESTRDFALERSTWNAYLDKPSAEVLLEAIDFLGGTPNPHSLCRHLTLNVAADARPIGALISVLEPNGALRIAGAFGLDDASLAARATQTAADSSPLVEAVRAGQPVFYSSAQLIRERFPDFASRTTPVMPTAIWPIMSRGDRIGAIQLFFDESHAESPLTADFEAVVALIALYVRLQLAAGVSHTRWSTVDRRQQSSVSAVTDERRRPSGISELTERQAAVLDHICAGRTNAQIAHVVGYSESTVRQETMAIYRTLGVEGRGQAAALARAHQFELAQAALADSPMI
jgi:DNA-binding CsgD family transcriptional regulator